MRILWLSDLDLRGSGYLNISIPLCTGLVEKGYELMCLGFGYKGQEHNYPFSIIPVANFQEIWAMLQNLVNLWKFDVFVVALDIPLQEQILMKIQGREFKYLGIMPIEADPLCMTWAMSLMQMDKVFIISEFGANEAKKVGVEAEHLQVGIDTNIWRKPLQEERTQIRKSMLGLDDDAFLVLTVADNQERKNLSKAMEIFAGFAEGKENVKWILVTREHNMVGWKLRDLADRYGISNELMIFERGMNFKELWSLYAASDCFLITSKAEGLCTIPEAKIWANMGYKKIKDIDFGDYVISHKGRVQIVDKKYERHYVGKMYKIKMSYGLPDIVLTPEHPIYAIKRQREGYEMWGKKRLFNTVPEWMPVRKLQKGDYVFYPKMIQVEYPRFVSVSDLVECVVEQGLAKLVGRNQFGSEFIHPSAKSIPDEFPITKGFMSLLGYYISEGCFTGEGVSFSFHSEELAYQKEVEYLGEELFGLSDLSISKRFRSRHRCDLRFYGTIIGRFLSKLCGKSSHEKHIPNWALWLRDDLLWELVRTMFYGDGNYQKKGQWKLRYSTVSKELAEQLQFVLFRLGVVSSLKAQKNRIEYTVTIHHQELCNVPFLEQSEIPSIKKKSARYEKLDNGYMLPIRDIEVEHYVGKVYNLEVLIDNSYLIGGIAVHNCMPALEAMSVGLPVIATNCTGMGELINEGRGIPVDYNYIYCDPFGNGNRYFARTESGITNLEYVYEDRPKEEVVRARKYVEGRTWDISVDQMDRTLKELDNDKKVSE